MLSLLQGSVSYNILELVNWEFLNWKSVILAYLIAYCSQETWFFFFFSKSSLSCII